MQHISSWNMWLGVATLALLCRVDSTGEISSRRYRRSESFNRESPEVTRFLRDTGQTSETQLMPPDNMTPSTDSKEGMNKENSENGNKKRKTDQYIVLPPDYNKFKLPWRSGEGPMKVDVLLEIRKVLNFDEIEETMTIDVDLVVGWTDYKILDYRNSQKGSPGRPISNMTRKEINDKKRIINDPDILHSIWKPNIIFENLISIKKPYVMATPVKLKVIPEAGFIQYITRLSVTVDCGLKFKYYPADTQTCEFSVRPFSYTSTLVSLQWHEQLGGVFLNDHTLPSFDVRADDLSEKFVIDSYEDMSRVFHVLTFNIHVRRNLSYHVVQTYLASGFYMIITCLCFLIPPRMVEARIGISMTTLLTLTAMFASVRESTPITSYVKAIDTWMVCCIFFVFLTLAQFTFYTWLRGVANENEVAENKVEDQSKNPNANHNDAPIAAITELNETEIRARKYSGRRRSITRDLKVSALQKYEKMAFFIEKYSFVIFLSIFGLYSTVYWIWLLRSADYYNWTVNPRMNYLEDHDYSDYLKSLNH